MRTMIAAMFCAVLLLGAGCGNTSDKGKNKDKDVPKAAKSE